VGGVLKRSLLVVLVIGLALGGPWAMAYGDAASVAEASDAMMDQHHDHAAMDAAEAPDENAPATQANGQTHNDCYEACSDCCALCGPSNTVCGANATPLTTAERLGAGAIGILAGLPSSPAAEPPKPRT
jgi:hypothetical protein